MTNSKLKNLVIYNFDSILPLLVVVIVVEAVGITVGVVDSGAIVTVDVDFVVAVVDVVSKGVVGLAIVCVLVAVVRVDFGFVVIAPAAVGVRIVVVVVGAVHAGGPLRW